MADIQIEIQGQDAIAAAQDLFSTCGLNGNYEIVEETQKEGTLAAIATVIGIVGTTSAAAEQIRNWYQDYKQGKSGKKIEKVSIVGRNGQRLLLDTSTLLEQIQKSLVG
ncbi:MAG TPA: hypothetical protein V6C85_21850 [Allocoleopsis sp.]